MAEVYQYIGHIAGAANAVKSIWEPVLMVVLLGCSAFFSGSESAFFNLSRRQINLLEKSKHKLQNLAARELSRPGRLLSCLLFGNMTVNILFYAVASVLVVRVERQAGAGAAAVVAILTFCLLVLFGEILPKSLAYSNSKPFTVAAGAPVFLILQIFTPLYLSFAFS